MKQLSALLLFVAVIFSCNTPANKDKDAVPESGGPLKDEFDNLESVFQSAAWQQVVEGDTSYFLFSRLSDNHYKIYNYRMANGAFATTDSAEIKAHGDKVIWEYRNMPAELLAADATSNSWKINLPDSSVAEFTIEKVDSIRLRWAYPDRAVTLRRVETPKL